MPVPNSIDDLSTTPAENSPLGTEQVFPNLDNYMRALAAFVAQLRDRLDAEGLPLGATQWWGGMRVAIQARFAPQDGQILNRADYPALWTLVSSGGYPLITEADWQASQLRRGSFSSGNGSTTFRMPDLNGKQTNSLGAVALRGDGWFSEGSPGLLQQGQNEAHGHSLTIDSAGAHNHPVNDPGHSHGGGVVPPGGAGVNYANQGANPYYGGRQHTDGAGTGIWLGSAGVHSHGGSIGSNGGNEARMKTATGCWLMRVK